MNDKFDISKFGSRFNEFIYGGSYSTSTSEVPETLTVDKIKEMADGNLQTLDEIFHSLQEQLHAIEDLNKNLSEG